LRDAVDFEFPSGASIGANGRVLVVSFDPVLNSDHLASFTAAYGSLAGIRLYGPFRGRLANSSDAIELEKPDSPETNDVPYVLVERVRYSDLAPWPAAADGTGQSLQRLVLGAYGNDPVNWMAAAPTLGTSAGGDTDADGMPDDWEVANGLNPNSALDANLDLDNDRLSNLQEYLSGTDPRDGGSALRLSIGQGVGSVVLSFTAAEEKPYTIEFSQTLQPGSWQTLLQVQPGAARIVNVPDPAPLGTRFYRVRTP
jgi:hypothetical protein